MYRHMDFRRCQRGLLALLVLLVLAGCSQLDLTAPRMPWQEDEDELEPPRKLVAFWSDTVLHQQGKPAVRGFGGRIFFYGMDDSQSLEVDGAVIVYAFDADRHDPATQKPEKKFVFTAQKLQDHFSQSRMGPSYSFWLPWDGVRGPTRNVSLVARYEGVDGTVVIADPVSKLLPGSNEIQMEQIQAGQAPAAAGGVQVAGFNRTKPQSDVRRVDYQEPRPSGLELIPSAKSGNAAKPTRRIETESIDLPPSFVRRLRRSGAARVSRSDASLNSTSAGVSSSPTRDSSLPMPGEVSGGHAVSAENQTSRVNLDPQPSRYGSRRFPARTQVSPLQGRGPLRRGPHLAGWQSGLPPTPRSGWNRTTRSIEPAYPTRWMPQQNPIQELAPEN